MLRFLNGLRTNHGATAVHEQGYSLLQGKFEKPVGIEATSDVQIYKWKASLVKHISYLKSQIAEARGTFEERRLEEPHFQWKELPPEDVFYTYEEGLKDLVCKINAISKEEYNLRQQRIFLVNVLIESEKKSEVTTTDSPFVDKHNALRDEDDGSDVEE